VVVLSLCFTIEVYFIGDLNIALRFSELVEKQGDLVDGVVVVSDDGACSGGRTLRRVTFVLKKGEKVENVNVEEQQTNKALFHSCAIHPHPTPLPMLPSLDAITCKGPARSPPTVRTRAPRSSVKIQPRGGIVRIAASPWRRRRAAPSSMCSPSPALPSVARLYDVGADEGSGSGFLFVGRLHAVWR
jgi:hypothetical protein